jgi:hypothetical protein
MRNEQIIDQTSYYRILPKQKEELKRQKGEESREEAQEAREQRRATDHYEGGHAYPIVRDQCWEADCSGCGSLGVSSADVAVHNAVLR